MFVIEGTSENGKGRIAVRKQVGRNAFCITVDNGERKSTVMLEADDFCDLISQMDQLRCSSQWKPAQKVEAHTGPHVA